MKLVLALLLVGLVIVVLLSNLIPKLRKDAPKPPRDASTRPLLPLPPLTERDEYVGGRPPSKGEKECRRVLERIYKVRFPTVRPAWLTSTETHAKLELDCYAEVPIDTGDAIITLPVACEYQGEQHYYKVDIYQDDAKHNTQRWNDEYKKRLCILHGVHLIEVPYTVKLQNIEAFIKKELSIRNILPEEHMVTNS